MRQFDVWVKECGFPEKGSFRRLEAMERNLEEKDRESNSVKRRFLEDWKAFGDW